MVKQTVTIRIEVGLCAKIREIQAEEIKKRNGNFSFSEALESVLVEALNK